MPLSPGEQLVSPPGAPPAPNDLYIVLRSTPVPPAGPTIYYNAVLASVSPSEPPVTPGSQMSTPPGVPRAPGNLYVVLEATPLPTPPGAPPIWQANIQPI